MGIDREITKYLSVLTSPVKAPSFEQLAKYRVFSWPTKETNQLVRWLRSSDFDGLCNFLESHPFYFAHPAVVGTLSHLRWVTRMSQTDEYSPSEYLVDRTVPYGTARTARELLTKIANIWVEAQLEGYEVKPKAKKRGRPPGRNPELYSSWDDFQVLNKNYEALREEIAELVSRVPKPTKQALVIRVSQWLKKEHLNSPWSLESCNDPTNEFAMRDVPLPDRIALSIARRSFGKRGRLLARYPVYALLAYWQYGDYTKLWRIKGEITRAEVEPSLR